MVGEDGHYGQVLAGRSAVVELIQLTRRLTVPDITRLSYSAGPCSLTAWRLAPSGSPVVSAFEALERLDQTLWVLEDPSDEEPRQAE